MMPLRSVAKAVSDITTETCGSAHVANTLLSNALPRPPCALPPGPTRTPWQGKASTLHSKAP
ncbi:hypothetical protein HaLaN_12859 [Haematococcus lacustris]|uniref:Uncharacterized protein n=1 Tax=Haematococcus lacustris TaxID=44745 RepID=A0A699Z1N0_HAELA|nr:hypothetical protein HaLaN_12859 [Haematococcus lacustris]